MLVDAQHVVDLALVGDAALPPGVAVMLHKIPVKEGVAPELAAGGEPVGRTARHLGGQQVFVQLELLGVGPYVHAVAGDVDGQIPDDGHPPGVGVLPEGEPLAEEEVLNRLPEVDVSVGEATYQ